MPTKQLSRLLQRSPQKPVDINLVNKLLSSLLYQGNEIDLIFNLIENTNRFDIVLESVRDTSDQSIINLLNGFIATIEELANALSNTQVHFINKKYLQPLIKKVNICNTLINNFVNVKEVSRILKIEDISHKELEDIYVTYYPQLFNAMKKYLFPSIDIWAKTKSDLKSIASDLNKASLISKERPSSRSQDYINTFNEIISKVEEISKLSNDILVFHNNLCNTFPIEMKNIYNVYEPKSDFRKNFTKLVNKIKNANAMSQSANLKMVSAVLESTKEHKDIIEKHADAFVNSKLTQEAIQQVANSPDFDEDLIEYVLVNMSDEMRVINNRLGFMNNDISSLLKNMKNIKF